MHATSSAAARTSSTSPDSTGSRSSPASFIWFLVLIVALAILIWISQHGRHHQRHGRRSRSWSSPSSAFLGGLAYIGFVIWDWRNQEWLITTRRVIRAEGVLNKSVVDTSLEKINDARLDQSVFGRIFGFGTLDILTAAEEADGKAISDFPMIAEPVAFKKAMFDQKMMLENPELAPPRYQRASPPPDMQPAEPMPPRAGSDRVAVYDGETAAAAPEPQLQPRRPRPLPPPSAARNPADDLGATLERLADLRDKGLITAEEYEAKKRDLLERM